MSLYPLLFIPTFHYRIWGGNNLKNFGKNIVEKNIGESWEISTVSDFVSIVSKGALREQNLNELVKKYKGDLVGNRVYEKYGDQFPLLIKFLDSATPLSVQVHPNDEYAKKHHNSFGKTEMWYILDTDKDSDLILGFEKNIDKDIYSKSLEEGTIESILRKVHPEKDDVVYIPSGKVHAIGKGITIVEIQQTSDVTYRIYDYDRIDKDGEKRELHIQQAKEVSDFSFMEEPLVVYDKGATEVILVQSSYFTTSRFIITEDKEVEDSPESFRILICTEGECIIESDSDPVELTQGQSVLIPANLKNIQIKPKIKTVLIEVHID